MYTKFVDYKVPKYNNWYIEFEHQDGFNLDSVNWLSHVDHSLPIQGCLNFKPENLGYNEENKEKFKIINHCGI